MLVPVKRFGAAKRRLIAVLDDDARARLAAWMAGRVLDAAGETPTFVACDDEQVRDWAERRGAVALWGPGLGLNGAVDDGVRQIAERGFDHIVVSHADLPRASNLLDVVRPDAVTLVPDRRRDGTNVMSFPTEAPVRAQYGGGSFGRHLSSALTDRKVPVEVRDDRDLSLDVDTALDLHHPLITEVLPAWLRTNPANLPVR